MLACWVVMDFSRQTCLIHYSIFQSIILFQISNKIHLHIFIALSVLFSLQLIFTHLNCFKYSYLIPIICKQSMGCFRGVMVKAMDCGIVVSEFILQWRYYVHFRANTLGKGMNPLSSQLWLKQYHYCSLRRKALALNHLQRLICH